MTQFGTIGHTSEPRSSFYKAANAVFQLLSAIVLLSFSTGILAHGNGHRQVHFMDVGQGYLSGFNAGGYADTVIDVPPASSTFAVRTPGQAHFSTMWSAQGAPPGTPQNLTGAAVGTTVTLDWLPPASGGVPTGYLVQASGSPGGPLLATLPLSGTSVVVPNVPYGTYYVRVRATNADGQSAPSNEIAVVVPGGGGCVSPPNAPGNLAGNVNGALVSLNWAPSIGGCAPTHYALQAGTGGGLSNVGTFHVGMLTGFTVSAPPGTYFVRVVALNSYGASAPSNEVAVTVVGGCTLPPNAPQSLTGNVSGTNVSLNWSPSAGECEPTSYTVLAGSVSGASNIAVASVGLQTGLSAIAPAGTYFIRTVASNAFGTSPPSNEIALTVTAVSGGADWRVTQRFVSVNGPDNCWVREQRERWTGAIFPDLPMVITRSGGSVTLASTFFQVNYVGTVSGSDFSASGGPLEGGGSSCQDGTAFQQRPGVSNLSGRFSADGQLMTATEVNSYLLTTGELVTYTWDWQATRRN